MTSSPADLHSRRTLFRQAAAFGAAIAVAPAILLAEGGADIVETTGGRVRGTTIDRIKWFRGVPYGADTSGKNRFMPPQTVAAWAGVRDCTNWGHLAPQRVNPNPTAYTRYVGWNNYRGGMSEDCLVMNIWTPGADNRRRAVLFVIHGGGYASGSGNLEALEGQHLARLADMVVVSVNHRLGMLGFLDLSSFGAGDLASSGNVGMMDLVLALRWVRDNIANFGGDPQNVTLTGQSGGGGKCSHLMAMPSAHGLFHKVAIQSGSTLQSGRHEQRQKDAETLWTRLGVGKGDLAGLQSVPFQQIVDNQGNSGPVLDGLVVPRDPFDPDAPAISAAVPMIIGTCLEDSGYMLADPASDAVSLLARLQEDLRPAGVEANAQRVLSAYRKAHPRKNDFLLRAMVASDRNVRRRAIAQAERKSAQKGAPVFVYRWDWPAHGDGARWGATHGSDISPALANPSTRITGNTAEGRVLARQLGISFATFAKTGKPGNTTVPGWDAYDAAKRSVMVFDRRTRKLNDPDRELREMWEELLQKNGA